MITKNTVFILGAGASADFGYPTGDKLRTFIYKMCKNSHDTFATNIATALAGDWDEDIVDYQKSVALFATRLYHAAGYTIDDFLERFQQTYLGIGKLAIAQAIAYHETHDKVYENDNWYRILLEEMRRGATLETLHNNNVSFITFNYDRSLEHFLFTSLTEYHERITKEQVVSIVGQIPIIHLYGQIDKLPWQSPDGRSYGRAHTPHQFKEYGKNINILFEKISEETLLRFEAAHSLIDKAERVYILGFGFHKNNLDHLHLEKFKNKEISGTAYDLSDDQIRTLGNYWGDFTRQNDRIIGDRTIAFAGKILYMMPVYDFIKNFARLD